MMCSGVISIHRPLFRPDHPAIDVLDTRGSRIKPDVFKHVFIAFDAFDGVEEVAAEEDVDVRHGAISRISL